MSPRKLIKPVRTPIQVTQHNSCILILDMPNLTAAEFIDTSVW